MEKLFAEAWQRNCNAKEFVKLVGRWREENEKGKGKEAKEEVCGKLEKIFTTQLTILPKDPPPLILEWLEACLSKEILHFEFFSRIFSQTKKNSSGKKKGAKGKKRKGEEEEEEQVRKEDSVKVKFVSLFFKLVSNHKQKLLLEKDDQKRLFFSTINSLSFSYLLSLLYRLLLKSSSTSSTSSNSSLPIPSSTIQPSSYYTNQNKEGTQVNEKQGREVNDNFDDFKAEEEEEEKGEEINLMQTCLSFLFTLTSPSSIPHKLLLVYKANLPPKGFILQFFQISSKFNFKKKSWKS